MPGAILVIVAYLAGSSLGPSVAVTPSPSSLECARTRAVIADSIQKVARSNSTGAVEVRRDSADLVVRAGVSGREVARLSCLQGGGA